MDDFDQYAIPLHRADLRKFMRNALIEAGIHKDFAAKIGARVLELFMTEFLRQLKLRGKARMRGWCYALRREGSEKKFALKINLPVEEENDGSNLYDYTES